MVSVLKFVLWASRQDRIFLIVSGSVEASILTAINLSSMGRERILNNEEDLPVIKSSPKRLCRFLFKTGNIRSDTVRVRASLIWGKGLGKGSDHVNLVKIRLINNNKQYSLSLLSLIKNAINSSNLKVSTL